MLTRLKNLLWHKEWSQEDVDKYIGAHQACYFTYAADEALRQRASSGGSVSALLIHLLEQGEIDGALVLDTYVEDNHVHPQFKIAQTREEIIAAQGSKYIAVYFAANALPLIDAFEGNLAVVALPCDATILQRYRQKHPEADAKIKLVITLYCGHNSRPELTDLMVQRLGGPDDILLDYQYQFGHWRGSLKATFEQHGEVIQPFERFSDYRNLYLFAQEKCHHCFDHYGYHCDISAGDVWSYEMKAHPIKHTSLITRTAQGEAAVQQALASSVLEGQPAPVETILNGQARTMPFHYNITSRARVGKLFGMQIKDQVQERVRWNDYIVALMALFNERLTRSPGGQKLVALLPRPFIKAYLYIMKGLESF